MNQSRLIAVEISKATLLRFLQYPILAVFILVVPRMMGPESYGKYAFFSSLYILLSMFTDFGIWQVFGRFIPEFSAKNEAKKINELVVNTLVFKTIIAIIVGFCFLFFLYYLKPIDYSIEFLIMIVLAFYLYVIEETLNHLLFGLNLIYKFAFRQLLRRILNLIFVFLFFIFYGIWGAIFSILFNQAVLLVTVYFWTKQYVDFRRLNFSFVFLKPFLSFGFLFYISSILYTAVQRFGNFLIEILTNESKEVAFFDISNQIFLISTAFIYFAFSSLIPTFIFFFEKSREDKVKRWVLLFLKYSNIFFVLIYYSIFFIGINLIEIFFSEAYDGVFINLIIVYLGVFPLLVAQVGEAFSIIYKQPIKQLFAIAVALIVFLLASVLLIPRYYSIGCSIATTLASYIYGILLYTQFRMHIPLRDSLKICLLSLISIPIFLLKTYFTNNFILLLIFLLIYIILLFSTKILNIEEFREIIQVIKSKE